MDIEWKNTKEQRETLKAKFGGRCGYCGEVLSKMQADHIKPVTRITTGLDGNTLPSGERKLLNPERNIVSNMMPACPSCNNSKGGYDLEGWRDLISRSAQIVAKQKPIFKAGVRFGVISVTENPVVFYFEKLKHPVPVGEGTDTNRKKVI